MGTSLPSHQRFPISLLVRSVSPGVLPRTLAAVAVLLSLLFLPDPLLADRNGNGALILHAAPSLTHSLGEIPTTEPLIDDCAEATTRVDVDEPLLWFLLASFPDAADPYIQGVQFGIRYDETALQIEESGFTLADNFRETDWPSSGAYARLYYSVPREDDLFQVAWFYGRAENGLASLFEVDPDRPALFYSDATSAPIPRLGSLGFGVTGYAPCSPGACCFREEPFCRFLPGEQCIDLGGSFLGVGTPCGTAGCQVGLCCFDLENCEITTAYDCEDRHGGFASSIPEPGFVCADYCVHPTTHLSWGGVRAIFRSEAAEADTADSGSPGP